MTIQEYIRILRKRGWIVIAAALLAAIAAYGVSYLQKDVYRATVYISAVPARADFGLGASAKDLLRNFTQNLRTVENAQRAIDRSKLDMNPYDFIGNLQVADDSSTFTIQVDAQAADPQVATQMALAIADEFVEERQQYYAQQDKRDRIEVKIRSRAINAPQIQPKPMINAIAGGVLGLLLGGGIALLLTWMEADLLLTPLAVERTLGLEVLGTIPTVAKNK
jgi:capsular polysaccharide biosynthesis protein